MLPAALSLLYQFLKFIDPAVCPRAQPIDILDHMARHLACGRCSEKHIELAINSRGINT